MIWTYWKDTPENELYALHVVSEFMMAIDCCIHVLCVLLAFVFVKEWYHTLCGCCHQCCLDKCVKNTQKRVARQLNSWHELDSYYEMRDDTL